jgi:hypothetical protein
MPLYLEIIFTIIGFAISIIGLVFGSKALFSIKKINKQRNEHGDNYQNSTINHGLNADDIIKIINNLPKSEIEKVREGIITTFGKEEPKNPKEGDIWIKPID